MRPSASAAPYEIRRAMPLPFHEDVREERPVGGVVALAGELHGRLDRTVHVGADLHEVILRREPALNERPPERRDRAVREPGLDLLLLADPEVPLPRRPDVPAPAVGAELEERGLTRLTR